MVHAPGDILEHEPTWSRDLKLYLVCDVTLCFVRASFWRTNPAILWVQGSRVDVHGMRMSSGYTNRLIVVSLFRGLNTQVDWLTLQIVNM